jgi:hypothetical protein
MDQKRFRNDCGLITDCEIAVARAVMRIVIATSLALGAAGCNVHWEHLPAGSVAGRDLVYDYSPSVIQTGNLRQVWWCGQDYDPYGKTDYTDTIQYESFNLSNNTHVGPMAVLGETATAWDGMLTCNPKVIRGNFNNPLGDGKTYSYAMYYVALGNAQSSNNSIGVAFSNDGIAWKKYPNPIITPEIQTGYGVGQPAIYNLDHNQEILMFYEDWTGYVHHVEAISSDGVHFHSLGILTANGMDPTNPQPDWGDMAYDAATGYWYAGFNLPLRNPSTTGGVEERGQYGIQLYRIPNASLLTGATPWELLTTIDTSLTGYESNFIPGFVRDPYGNLNVGSYPTIEMYIAISNPPPTWNASPHAAGLTGGTAFWDLSTVSWVPNHSLRTLNRYGNQTTQEVTTGWIDPYGNFSLESTLGHLYESPQQGATVPFYNCKSGETDYFVTLDIGCEGARMIGLNGYGYSKPVAGLNLVTLYRCTTATDDFVSNNPGCDSQAAGKLLGYALP